MSAEKVAELAERLAEKADGGLSGPQKATVYDTMFTNLSGWPERRLMEAWSFSKRHGIVFLGRMGWAKIEDLRKHGGFLETEEEFRQTQEARRGSR